LISLGEMLSSLKLNQLAYKITAVHRSVPLLIYFFVYF